MTLHEFRDQTRHLPPATEILILAPWGEIAPATWVAKEDLEDDDPVKSTFPATAILLAEAAPD